MNEGPDLDLLELHRRLTDLADSGGPWDDPLPEVRRRAVMTPTPARVPRRWWPASFTPVNLACAAAAVVTIAGIGWVVAGAGGGTEEKASSANGGAAATRAAAAGRAPGSKLSDLAKGGSPAPSTSAGATPAPKPPQTSAGTVANPAPTSPVCVAAKLAPALVVVAPGAAVAGAQVRVQVRNAAAVSAAPPVILVRSGAAVVGRLVPTAAVPGAHPTPPRRVDDTDTDVVTGTLRLAGPVCGQSAGLKVPAATPTALGPLPAGRYELVAVTWRAGSFVVSSPVAITVTK